MSRRGAAGAYPIRAVARMTGLSVDTLRAWERRYDAVVPRRGERGRVYSDADVARLRQLAALVAGGHAIGTVAGLTTAQLTGLINGGNAFRGPRPDATAADLSALIQSLDRYDLAGIETALGRHAAVLQTSDLVFAVILPLLRDLGERWDAGTLSPAQEHLISAIVRSALGGLLRTIGRATGSPGIVLATPAGERHELGLLCAAVLAADAGGSVLYLGPDLPAADIAHAAARADAGIVILGVTTPGAVTRGEAMRLGKALAGVEVWVGGPQASSVQAEIGHSALVDRLEDLVPMLLRRGR